LAIQPKRRPSASRGHLGKWAISGPAAGQIAERWLPGAAAIAPLTSLGQSGLVGLRLSPQDYLLLSLSDHPLLATLRAAEQPPEAALVDQSGALGCFALAGPRRDEVLERSSAMDLRRDRTPPGTALQTTLHTIGCTLYRQAEFDLILPPRSLAEALFEALIDVGGSVGLRPAGIVTLPIELLSG
jgi:heterotetrameric sarcosine oxidase gamma subunit